MTQPAAEGLPEEGPSPPPATAGFAGPFIAIFLGELALYAAARGVVGNPAERGLHGGSQTTTVLLFAAAALGQLVGVMIWARLRKAPFSRTGAMVLGTWSALDQTAYFRRDSINVAELLLGMACCGVPGALSGMAFGTLGAAVLKARRQ